MTDNNYLIILYKIRKNERQMTNNGIITKEFNYADRFLRAYYVGGIL